MKKDLASSTRKDVVIMGIPKFKIKVPKLVLSSDCNAFLYTDALNLLYFIMVLTAKVYSLWHTSCCVLFVFSLLFKSEHVRWCLSRTKFAQLWFKRLKAESREREYLENHM